MSDSGRRIGIYESGKLLAYLVHRSVELYVLPVTFSLLQVQILPISVGHIVDCFPI